MNLLSYSISELRRLQDLIKLEIANRESQRPNVLKDTNPLDEAMLKLK